MTYVFVIAVVFVWAMAISQLINQKPTLTIKYIKPLAGKWYSVTIRQ